MRMTNKSLMFRLRARVECMLIYKSENMWLQTPTVDTYIYMWDSAGPHYIIIMNGGVWKFIEGEGWNVSRCFCEFFIMCVPNKMCNVTALWVHRPLYTARIRSVGVLFTQHARSAGMMEFLLFKMNNISLNKNEE